MLQYIILKTTTLSCLMNTTLTVCDNVGLVVVLLLHRQLRCKMYVINKGTNMATLAQTLKVLESLKIYKRRYVKKQFNNVDESATRIMINMFLTDVLEYKELDEIKTEYAIRGEYADYVIQLKRKKQFVVEVKSAQLDLNERHLRQSLSYASNEGIDWILLTNGRVFQFYRVIFEKPMRTELLVDIDFSDASSKQMKQFADVIVLFTRRSVEKNEHELFWQKSIALAPRNISKLLFCEEVVKLIKRELKKTSTITFENDAIKDALRACLAGAVNVEQLRFKNVIKRSEVNIAES